MVHTDVTIDTVTDRAPTWWNDPYTVRVSHDYSKKLKEPFDIMIFIERYPLKRCQGCVKLIASKVNCFLNFTDLSEVQLCMSSNSWTWECPHTKYGADHVPLIFWVVYIPAQKIYIHVHVCIYLCAVHTHCILGFGVGFLELQPLQPFHRHPADECNKVQ